MAEYFSFEDVMGELELGEEELKRMVSEGELRAFRDENKMKFKKEDVENLKKGRITEPTIILPSTPATDKTDETVLDLDIGAETAALSDTSSAPTVEFDEGAFGGSKSSPNVEAAETDDDLIVTEPSSIDVAAGEPEETFLEEESDTGLTTEPLKLADDAGGEAAETIEAESVTEEAPAVDEAEASTEEVAAPVASGRSRAGTRMGRRVTAAHVPVAVEEEVERVRANPIWTFFSLLTFLVGAASMVFYYDMMRLESGTSDQPMGLTAGAAKSVLDSFWKDAKWKGYHESEFPEGGTVRPPFPDASKNPLLDYKKEVYDGPSFQMPDTPPRDETIH